MYESGPRLEPWITLAVMSTREETSPANLAQWERPLKITNPVVYFIWQSQRGYLVHKGNMAHRVKCFGKIQSYNIDKVIGRQHVTDSMEQGNESRGS